MKQSMDARSFVFIGDLHLTDAEPAGPRAKRYKDRAFFPDDDFEGLIARLLDEGRSDTLVLLGDLVDFDLIEVPGAASDWRASARAKLDRVASDHRVFFRALARWISADRGIVFVLGNHDLEFHDPSVREAFFGHIRAAAAVEGRGLDPASLEARFVFEPSRLTEAGFFHAEHGHRFDPYSAVPDPLAPWVDGEGGRLFLPLGSLVNRHVTNRLHTFDPLTPGALALPATSYLWHLVARYPPLYLPYHFCTGALRVFVESMRQRRAWLARPGRPAARGATTPLPLAIESPWRTARVLWLDRVALFFLAAGVVGAVAAGTRSAGTTALATAALAVLGYVYARAAGPREVKHYAERVEEAVPALGAETRAPVVVLGHTHRPADEMRGTVRYLNPGSWAASTEPGTAPRRAIRLWREAGVVRVEWVRIA